jgi:hypothetical protein
VAFSTLSDQALTSAGVFLVPWESKSVAMASSVAPASRALRTSAYLTPFQSRRKWSRGQSVW